MIQHHLNRITPSGCGNAQAVLDDGENLTVGGVELAIAFEGRLRQIAKRRARRLLTAALPACAGAGLLLGAGLLKAFHVEFNTGVPGSIDHEVEWEAIGLVKMKRCTSFEKARYALNLFHQG